MAWDRNALEKLLQSKKDKNQIKRKEKEKKIKIEPRPYQKGIINEIEYNPGQVVWGRQTGKNPFYEWYENDRKNKMAMTKDKIGEALKSISRRHGIYITASTETMGDYVLIRTGDKEMKISNSFIAQVDLISLTIKIETTLGISQEERDIFPKEWEGDIKKEEKDTRSETEKWADEWANKNKEKNNGTSRELGS